MSHGRSNFRFLRYCVRGTGGLRAARLFAYCARGDWRGCGFGGRSGMAGSAWIAPEVTHSAQRQARPNNLLDGIGLSLETGSVWRRVLFIEGEWNVAVRARTK
jgi:hypothetical protein